MLIASTSFAQLALEINFDDTAGLNRLFIDTTSNHNNIWQIGRPNKKFFTSAYSLPNAIVTDTLNPYPINDTSSFTIVHISSYGWGTNQGFVDIEGEYFVNSDTLTDHGYIEFSSDKGKTWSNLDSAINDGACGEPPTFSGNSNGWKYFHYCLSNYNPVPLGDTILYRFTFISDSFQTNKNGLMFDDLYFDDWIEGIEQIQNDNLISISPNPSSENLFIHGVIGSDKSFIQVFDYTGNMVYENKNFRGNNIDTRNLQNGFYLLKYSDSKNLSIKKFVVQHL